MKLILIGKPVPLKRPRFSIRTKRVYNSQHNEMVANSFIIASQANGKQLTGPVKMEICFYMPIPKYLSKKKRIALINTPHFIKCDIDNLEKKFLDECTMGGIWKDDCQVATLSSKKIYSMTPCIVAIINPLI